MGERLGLRLRFALFFAAIALGGIAVLATGLWAGHARYGGAVEGYVIAGLIAGFALAGIAAWVGYLFDENVARPILGLASDLSTRARSDVGAGIDQDKARYLGALAPAADAIHAALADAREAQQRAVEQQTARINRDKALLAALLHDLTEAAVVLTPDLRIMLYNRTTRDLLGPIGLDRPIGQFLRSEPLEDAIARLAAKQTRGEAEAERFLAATLDGNRFLLGRISPVFSEDERIGHVLIFHDATDDLKAHATRDHLFNTLLEQVRRPAAAISAVLDVLEQPDTLPDELRATFNAAMREELDRLFVSIRESGETYSRAAAAHWPMSEVAVEDLFDALKARGRIGLQADCDRHFVRCDGFAIIALLTKVTEGLAANGTRTGLRLEAEAHDREIWLVIRWQGVAAPDGEIDSWIRAPISEAYGDYTGRDVLDGHRTEIWSETQEAGNRIVLPLATAREPALAPRDSRPEFYDFDLPRPEPGGDMARTALRDLKFVVFDTETTGLSPRGGDEIVQIAGLRLVNGRILTGEAFDTFVDPGRPIPPASTAVHGIDDKMVAGAPGIAEAGKRFHDFCEGAVLVAHNAPFDLAFLRLKEEAIGRRFRQPALCTVLLSAALFDHTGEHTLDALAARFGVEIPTHLRHTALGDAMATAEVFLKMLNVMEAEGIRTLGDAIDAGQKMSQIRRAQNY